MHIGPPTRRPPNGRPANRPAHRPSNRSLTLRALALSLGLHAAAAAAYGGYHLGGFADSPPRLDVAGSAWITISIRGEPGADGGASAGGRLAEIAGESQQMQQAQQAQQARASAGAPDAEVTLGPVAQPASALPLVVAAAPALEAAALAIGRSLEDVVEASMQSVTSKPEAEVALEPPVPLAAGPEAWAVDGGSDPAAAAGGADGAEGADDAGSAGGGAGAAGAVAAGPGGGGGEAGAGAGAGDASAHGLGDAGDGAGVGAGEGSGGGAAGSGVRGLGDDGRNQPPEYPPAARRAGQEGEVIVLALSDATGAVSQVSVEKSSGFPLLDEAALAAVRGWSFVPATENGVAVAGYVRVPIRFVLRR